MRRRYANKVMASILSVPLPSGPLTAALPRNYDDRRLLQATDHPGIMLNNMTKDLCRVRLP
jgi:hypothetical protein